MVVGHFLRLRALKLSIHVPGRQRPRQHQSESQGRRTGVSDPHQSGRPAKLGSCARTVLYCPQALPGDLHDPVLSPSSLLLLAILLVPSRQSAESNPDRFQFNHDIHIEADEKAGDVTCIGCSVYVRGQVSGDVTAIAGSVFAESGRLDRGRPHRDRRQCPGRERRPGGGRPDGDWRDTCAATHRPAWPAM